MTHTWNSICLRVGDAALGWTLNYPRDFVVIALGVCLGVLLYLVRRLTTNSQYLLQIAADQRRLRELIRAARDDHDNERLQRYQHIRNLVRTRRSQAELGAVCLSLLILTALTTWGQHRLSNLPWRIGETVKLTVTTPPSAIGQIIHVVPQNDLDATDGWIHTIQSSVVDGRPSGKAEWSFRIHNGPIPREIILYHGTRQVSHELQTNQSPVAAGTQRHPGSVVTHILPRPSEPLGLFPQYILPGLPGWALLLMLVATPTFLGLRRMP